jgi:ribosomal protein S8
MSLTYIHIISKLKNALRKKQFSIKINFTYQNLKFLHFLLKNNYISGFEKKQKNKRLFLVIFLKYDSNFLPAINDFSSISSASRKHPKQKILKKHNINFVVELFSSNNTSKNYNYSILLSKFR